MESSIKHGTFVITRHYSKAARQVFAAFADPAKKRRWFLDGPNNHVDEFEMNFQVGGIERARYHQPGRDASCRHSVCERGPLSSHPDRPACRYRIHNVAGWTTHLAFFEYV